MRPVVAVFCCDGPDSFIGRHVRQVVAALAARGRKVHVFSREPFSFEQPSVRVTAVGSDDATDDLLAGVREFNRRASNAFFQTFPVNEPVEVVAHEWSSGPVLGLLRGLRNQTGLLSLHSLEAQRSDLSSELSQQIAALEAEAITSAGGVLFHDPQAARLARDRHPERAERFIEAREMFPLQRFQRELDPGAVKARYQVGPVDPTLLYVGDLEERYGPDLLLRAMPAILRHHPQARLVIVGDGHLYWPLKVFTRYLLLEHAVRLIGHLPEAEVDDLFLAADVIVVPSREATPWWPVQAAWACRKPVVATHESARTLTEHEKDSVLIYPSENSIVWGVERLLYDPALAQTIAAAGRRKVEERFGWSVLAQHLEEVLHTTRTA